MVKYLPTQKPENSERLGRLTLITARLVDKILKSQSLNEAIARSKPDE